MRIFFDTNIIIDHLDKRVPFDTEADSLFRLVTERAIEGFCSANSLTDIFYVLNRKRKADAAKATILDAIDLLSIVSVNEHDCRAALVMDMDDFEDALVAVCAKKAGADYIVTRDEGFLSSETGVKAVTPTSLLALVTK